MADSSDGNPQALMMMLHLRRSLHQCCDGFLSRMSDITIAWQALTL
jgi:hypothetical protein